MKRVQRVEFARKNANKPVRFCHNVSFAEESKLNPFGCDATTASFSTPEDISASAPSTSGPPIVPEKANVTTSSQSRWSKLRNTVHVSSAITQVCGLDVERRKGKVEWQERGPKIEKDH
ncbi:hypothetical protein TNCV_107121 [Trichonephila clavipes]|nr:hypothetical protein TNCV_107121 [Trichonephila clavipes]